VPRQFESDDESIGTSGNPSTLAIIFGFTGPVVEYLVGKS
jgi:hypothetical protein